MRFRHDESGQVLVLSAVCMLVLVGFMALAVDVGLLMREKRNLQIAADAGAVNAAGAELSIGDWSAAGKAAANLNGVPKSAVTVNNPPTLGAFKGTAGYVEVIVTQSEPTFFMRAFGRNSMTIDTRAVAEAVTSRNCIYAMQTSPSGGNGIALSGGSTTLSATNCGLVVNAGGSSAVSATGGASITAYSVSVAGSGVNLNGHSTITTTNPTTVTTGMTPATDPLSGIVSAPANPGSCTAKTVNSSATIGPASDDLICYSSLTVSSNGVVATLNPGVYYINGNLTVQGGASLSGSGVTFYITNGGTVTVSGGSALNIFAPTSGAYSGILFYQDPTDTNTATFTGGSSGTISGIFYMPNAELNFSGGSGATFNVDLVVGWLNISGGSTVNPYIPLAGASPLSTPNLAE